MGVGQSVSCLHSNPNTTILNCKPNTKLIKSIGAALIHGYMNDTTLKSVVPNDLIKLITRYYGKEFVDILSFSAASSTNSHHILSRLHDNNKCIEIIGNTINSEHEKNNRNIASEKTEDGYRGIISVTAQHEFCGIHCWRINTYNPNNANIIWGVTQPQNILNHHGFITSNIYGVSHLKVFGSTNNYNKHDLSQFKQHKFNIDILLNINNRTLKICVVNNGKNSIHFDNVNGCTWIPFILYWQAQGAQFRIAKIPNHLYSKDVPIWIQ